MLFGEGFTVLPVIGIGMAGTAGDLLTEGAAVKRIAGYAVGF
ncbi:MAG: hypothetical protein ACXW1U_20210 [Methylobacter sp.]